MAEQMQPVKPQLQIDPQQFAQEVANEIAADLRKGTAQQATQQPQQ